MHSQSGQESAPFELLIAIVIMTFVIVIGFNALDKLNTETCRGKVNQGLEEMRTAIEAVVKNKSKANVSYELPGCFREEDAKLTIIDSDTPAYCSAICGGSISSCTVLRFYSPEYSESKCLRISAATSFSVDAGTCNINMLEQPEGYGITDWKKPETGILPGQYTLIRQSNLFSSAPVICAFRRAG